MTHLLFRKVLGGLRPADADGDAVMAKIKHGALVKVEIKRSRNLGHHRKFFALVNLVFDNQSHYEVRDHLLTALKVALGHCETVILKTGETAFIPRSISFASMDQTQFEQFWDKACDLVVRRFLPGVDRAALEAEILELIEPPSGMATGRLAERRKAS